MKIRTGFVSNSSSSSFIVGMWHKPESVQDIKNMFFKYVDLSEECTSGEMEEDLRHDLATRLWGLLTDPGHIVDLSNQEEVEDILDDIRQTTVWYEYCESLTPDDRVDTMTAVGESEEQKTYLDLRTKVIWKSFLNRAITWQVDPPVVVRFEIGDHDRIDGLLEHGDFIQFWPVIRINHH